MQLSDGISIKARMRMKTSDEKDPESCSHQFRAASVKNTKGIHNM